MFRDNFQLFDATTYKSIRGKYGMMFVIDASYFSGCISIPWLKVKKCMPLSSPSPDVRMYCGVKRRTFFPKFLDWQDATMRWEHEIILGM